MTKIIYSVATELGWFVDLGNAERRAKEIGSVIEPVWVDDDEYSQMFDNNEFRDDPERLAV